MTFQFLHNISLLLSQVYIDFMRKSIDDCKYRINIIIYQGLSIEIVIINIYSFTLLETILLKTLSIYS